MRTGAPPTEPQRVGPEERVTIARPSLLRRAGRLYGGVSRDGARTIFLSLRLVGIVRGFGDGPGWAIYLSGQEHG